MHIRPARPQDAAAIHALHMAAIRAIDAAHYTTTQLLAWCGRRTPADYLAPMSTRVMLVAQDAPAATDAAPLGFGQLQIATGSVEAVYVLPAAQGRGIGALLLQALEQHAGGAGVRALRLDASMNAAAFYTRRGFAPIQVNEHPVGDGVSIPCLHMRKALAG